MRAFVCFVWLFGCLRFELVLVLVFFVIVGGDGSGWVDGARQVSCGVEWSAILGLRVNNDNGEVQVVYLVVVLSKFLFVCCLVILVFACYVDLLPLARLRNGHGRHS